jgi:hypothetical protein
VFYGGKFLHGKISFNLGLQVVFIDKLNENNFVKGVERVLSGLLIK